MYNPSNKKARVFEIALLLAFVIVIVHTLAFNDEQAFESQYCRDVQTWEANKHVSPYDRPGHPNYRNLEC